ncbi:MAG: D-tyrosyl-tRNA(Tyr) deacylase [Gammaproteobacteria bacterium]|nr:D-tyrosyl-tRNA(Tyr) deacylase [Gammaproteobacteria bacterium]
MIILLQRVSQAAVVVEEQIIGQIGAGLLLLLAVEPHDGINEVVKLAERVLNYRVFADDADKMNLSARDVQAELLVVSQFTLAADTRKGLRPSFAQAAAPEQGLYYYEAFVTELQRSGLRVATGQFGANMQVSLINDGPVTFRLQV